MLIVDGVSHLMLIGNAKKQGNFTSIKNMEHIAEAGRERATRSGGRTTFGIFLVL